ncbi:hypothetical protein V8C26DRAFT_383651 [Trichoderma gracile]
MRPSPLHVHSMSTTAIASRRLAHPTTFLTSFTSSVASFLMPGDDIIILLQRCALCHLDIVSGDGIQIGTTGCLVRLRWNPECMQVQVILCKCIQVSGVIQTRHPILGGFESYHVGCLNMTGL